MTAPPTRLRHKLIEHTGIYRSAGPPALRGCLIESRDVLQGQPVQQPGQAA
jgi:hypothetical protein